ncbi:hypothetical protein HUG17_5007 [Dermatophagoides farinae]|uniref:Uncharacterized protein n=1 Tax=Dermatophagoides farinae TaxID=6954 RepID=A0A9D4SHE3_DERFA|nr:hypothetical protein HUG17_5007 [Dermatophagoides farinae]
MKFLTVQNLCPINKDDKMTTRCPTNQKFPQNHQMSNVPRCISQSKLEDVQIEQSDEEEEIIEDGGSVHQIIMKQLNAYPENKLKTYMDGNENLRRYPAPYQGRY